MANLTEASTWDTVYQLESTDQALAGAGGTMNRQAQALLNRTKYLADTKLNTADFKTQINASGSAPVYACRAWVNFNGTGTVAIRASGNVSSVTDVGVGLWTLNFISAMPHADYTLYGNTLADSSGNTVSLSVSIAGPYNVGASLKTASAVQIRLGNGSSVFDAVEVDCLIVC